MASKTPPSLFDRIRTAVSTLGNAAERTARWVRGAGVAVPDRAPPPRSPVPPPVATAPAPEPRPVASVPSTPAAPPAATARATVPPPAGIAPAPSAKTTEIVSPPPRTAEPAAPQGEAAVDAGDAAPGPVRAASSPGSPAPAAPEVPPQAAIPAAPADVPAAEPVRPVARAPAASPTVAEPEVEARETPARTWTTVDPIGDTIAALRAVGRAFGGLEAWPMPVRPWRAEGEPPPIPAGARFDRHVFTSSAGRREHLLYVPASLGARPNGLVLMLHGCRQTPEDFAIGTRMNAAAEAMGLLVDYPHQPTSANPNGCWNWYRLADHRRHGGEPAILAGIVCELMETWGLEREHVFVAGLSAGGAMTSILTRTHPELFAAACIHSGVAADAADDLRSGLAAMRGRFHRPPAEPGSIGEIVPTIVFQGDADETVHPSNADRIFSELDPGGENEVRVETRAVDGGRATVTTRIDATGCPIAEMWHVAGEGHAWFGGDPAGSWSVASGPDATGEMLRFFAAQGARRQTAASKARLRRN